MKLLTPAKETAPKNHVEMGFAKKQSMLVSALTAILLLLAVIQYVN